MTLEKKLLTAFIITIIGATVLCGGGNILYVTYGVGILVVAGLLTLLWEKGYLVVLKSRIWYALGVLFMGFLGMLRLAVGGVFLLLMMQTDEEERQMALSAIPWMGVAITVICGPCFFLPALHDTFYTLNRLTGPFPYANICAMFFLVGIVLLLGSYGERKPDLVFYLQFAVLFAGVLLTGCRSVFVLVLPALLYSFLKRKRLRLPLGIMAGGGMVAAGAYALLSGDTSGIGRFATTSVHSATLSERIICWRDGWSVFLQHPLGLGYKGFTMLENAIQTGPYEVQYVHNDWLQLLLDHGVLGFVGFTTLFIWMVVRQKEEKRLLLILLAIHFFVDFSLQYEVTVLILLLLLPLQGLQEVRVEKRGLCTAAGTLLIVLLVWTSIADIYRKVGNYAASIRVYSWNWQVRMFDIASGTDIETIPERAEVLLQQNPWNPTAYNAWSIYYQRHENYSFAIDKGKAALRLHTYDMTAYDNLILYYGQAIEQAKGEGNEKLVLKWTEELQDLYDQWEQLQEDQDELSRQIAKDDAYDLSDLSLKMLAYYHIH